MEEPNSQAKATRLLTLYAWLKEGRSVKKSEAAAYFRVAERSIQRDLDELRSFFADQSPPGDIEYDPRTKGYSLTLRNANCLNNSEILAVCKILLESRSMIKEELEPILKKLVACCVPSESRKAVTHMIANESRHMIEPHHGRPVLPLLWELSSAVQEQKVTEIEYERLKEPRLIKRVVEPVGIMFSEYFFYLTAFLRNVDRDKEFQNKDDLFPTIYRIDGSEK